MQIDATLLDKILSQAQNNPRLRQSMDLRTTVHDNSQRILNAMQPGTMVPIHRHTKTTETLILLRGKLEEIFYEEVTYFELSGDSRCTDVCHRRSVRETQRILLEAGGAVQGICIPVGQWHSVRVIDPTVILECKDGAYEPQRPEDTIEL